MIRYIHQLPEVTSVESGDLVPLERYTAAESRWVTRSIRADRLGLQPRVYPGSGSVWIITHNLGRHVGVIVTTLGGFEVDAAIEHVDENTVRVLFNQDFSGFAVIL